MHRLCSVLFIVFLTAAASSGANRPASVPQHSAGGVARFSDGEIEQKIKTKLAKSKIGKDGFVPKVKGGVVTWTGHTSVPQHKGAATRMAKSSGAVRVVNNIEIASGTKPGQPARHAKVEPAAQSEQ